jgi:hypothetical protein
LDFAAHDIFYNGSITLEYTTFNGSKTCQPFLGARDATFSIGQMDLASNSSISRSSWDNNPFYMNLAPRDEVGSYPGCDASSGKRQNCPALLRLASSETDYWWTQVWTLQSIKNGNAFDISGHISTNKTFRRSNDVGINFPAEQGQSRKCADFFGTSSLWYNDTVTMTGKVTAGRADIVFTIGDLADTPSDRLGATLVFRFSGTWWNQGASLVTKTANITTSGKSKYYNTTKSTKDVMKNMKIIIPIVAVCGPLFVMIVIGCCFWRSLKKKKILVGRRTSPFFWIKRFLTVKCDHSPEQGFAMNTSYERQDSQDVPPPAYSEESQTGFDSSKDSGRNSSGDTGGGNTCRDT